MEFIIIVLGALIMAGSVAGFVLLTRKTFKEKMGDKKSQIAKICTICGVSLALGVGAYLINLGYNDHFNVMISVKDGVLIALFSILFFFVLGSGTNFFIQYYYNVKQLDKKLHKNIGVLLGISYFLAFVFFVLWLEGGAEYFTYPLISGISFTENGICFNTYLTVKSLGGFHIQLYAILIISGALLVYALCDHKFYKTYGEHGMLSTLFLIAFPAGILGGRIWYVVGNWTRDGFDQNFLKVFAIWDGGLTILGGAVGGIIAGVLFAKLAKRTKFRTLDAVDIIVPCILIAQAIGRWGNFFNHEVYGEAAIAMSDGWMFPTWIKYQMAEEFVGGVPSEKFRLPLFLIEGILNITGYFFIVYGAKLINYIAHKKNPTKWGVVTSYGKKYAGTAGISKKSTGINSEIVENSEQNVDKSVPIVENSADAKVINNGPYHKEEFLAPGVIGSFYLIVYGIIRLPLEFLRDPGYNMGNDNLWSVINSGIYIGIGILCIVLAFVYRHYKEKIDTFFKKIFYKNKAK